MINKKNTSLYYGHYIKKHDTITPYLCKRGIAMGLFSESDRYFFHQGTNYEVYKSMGAHLTTENKVKGTRFAVWAPHAREVSVITDVTGWKNEYPMEQTHEGIWEVFIKGLTSGAAYRYVITGPDGLKREKSDPYAFRTQLRPLNASVVCPLDGYKWHDEEYQSNIDSSKVTEKPMAVYEVHLGSWKKAYKDSEDEDGFMNYRELAKQLVKYINFMGYTHIELMGICEYPFDPSWGYQVTGMYAPTARYGTPDDFRYFVDLMHQNGISVILDWIPAHFPKDDFAMNSFDGTPLYESSDPLRAEFPIWGTKAYDHGKPEVRSFLISSAFYWIKEFHIDALRVDAVEAMLYADFSRPDYRPNIHGGHINLESESFLKQLCSEVTDRTGAYIIAEDSSIEQGITEDIHKGGLGFTFKWNLGWMYDTLSYLSHDFHDRRNFHHVLTHTPDYAFTENFILVLSHDDVCPGKKSILEKQPGSTADRFSGTKALYTLQFTHPGKKLLFMGQDFAQIDEWHYDKSLDWYLTDDFNHDDVMKTVKNLICIYKKYPALHSDSKDSRTFEWINRNFADGNIISFIRKSPRNYDGALLVICNFSPWYHHNFSCGAPKGGGYERIFSTYDNIPGQGGPKELGGCPYIEAQYGVCDGKPFRLSYGLRPFEALILRIP